MKVETTYIVTNNKGGLSVEIPTGRGAAGYKYVTIRADLGRWANRTLIRSTVTHGRHLCGYDDPRKAALAVAVV